MTRARTALLLIFIAGAAVRLVVPLPGTPDVPDWKATAFVASSDLLRVYGAGGSPPDERKLVWERVSATTEYPPVDQLEMAIVGRLYRAIDPEFHDGPLLTALIKLPGLVAEIDPLSCTLLTWGRRVLGEAGRVGGRGVLDQSRRLARRIGARISRRADGGAGDARRAGRRGQSAASGRRARGRRRPDQTAGRASCCRFSASCCSGRDGRMRLRPALSALAAGLAVTVACDPAVRRRRHACPSFWRAVQRLGEHDLVSGTATNAGGSPRGPPGHSSGLSELGWTGALSRPATMVRISTVVAQGMPNPRTVGIVLTAAALGWAMWRSRRGVTAPVGALVGAWCVLAYFMVSGQVHENHAYLALPLLGLAAGRDAAAPPLVLAHHRRRSCSICICSTDSARRCRR